MGDAWRFALALVLLVAAWSGAACLVVSVQPIYDGESIVFDESLIGAWADADAGIALAIEPGEWRSYRISATDRFGTVPLTGYLTEIGKSRYIDLTPAGGLERGELFVPMHAVLKVAATGDTITASPLSYEWFSKALAGKTLGGLAAAFDTKQNVLITGSTRGFRAWLSARGARPAIFGDVLTFERKKAPAALPGEALRKASSCEESVFIARGAPPPLALARRPAARASLRRLARVAGAL